MNQEKYIGMDVHAADHFRCRDEGPRRTAHGMRAEVLIHHGAFCS
jgi:hypothetical protein